MLDAFAYANPVVSPEPHADWDAHDCPQHNANSVTDGRTDCFTDYCSHSESDECANSSALTSTHRAPLPSWDALVLGERRSW
jgi:hypothetical protein